MRASFERMDNALTENDDVVHPFRPIAVCAFLCHQNYVECNAPNKKKEFSF